MINNLALYGLLHGSTEGLRATPTPIASFDRTACPVAVPNCNTIQCLRYTKLTFATTEGTVSGAGLTLC